MARLALAIICILTAFSQAYASCNPNAECRACILRAPITGHCIQMGNDVTCEGRKKVCQKCGAIKAAATGLSLACAYCVLASTPANPTCIAICGGAGNADAVAAAGNCDP
jgi:hypothetical protein